jgi:cytoskeletal protein CcmA (bactofilin family)
MSAVSPLDSRWSTLAPALDAQAEFTGVLTYRGSVRIDGRLEGEVRATGSLLVGEAGWVKGRVEVDELVVAGTLEGEIEARGRVELLPSARVRANVRTPRLVLAEGCVLNGRCETRPAGAGGSVGAPPKAARPS